MGYVVKKEIKFYNYFGAIVSLCRLCENISVKELATRMNVPSTYICDVESGIKGVSLQRSMEFAVALNLPHSTMFSYLEFAQSCNGDYKKTLLYMLTKYILLLEQPTKSNEINSEYLKKAKLLK